MKITKDLNFCLDLGRTFTWPNTFLVNIVPVAAGSVFAEFHLSFPSRRTCWTPRRQQQQLWRHTYQQLASRGVTVITRGLRPTERGGSAPARDTALQQVSATVNLIRFYYIRHKIDCFPHFQWNPCRSYSEKNVFWWKKGKIMTEFVKFIFNSYQNTFVM
jgi:hypothetical protein